jgi:hypothetical protein
MTVNYSVNEKEEIAAEYSNICLEGLKRISKNLSGYQSPDRDSTPPKCEAGVASTWPSRYAL